MKINLKKLLDRFNRFYMYLYSYPDSNMESELAAEFDKNFAPYNPETLRCFAEYRGDVVSSDREAAAFILALSTFTDFPIMPVPEIVG